MLPEPAARDVEFAHPAGVVREAFGGYGGGETPGPIPNPEVKPLSADGTAREASWESRTPPEHTLRRGPVRLDSALFVLALALRVCDAGRSRRSRADLAS